MVWVTLPWQASQAVKTLCMAQFVSSVCIPYYCFETCRTALSGISVLCCSATVCTPPFMVPIQFWWGNSKTFQVPAITLTARQMKVKWAEVPGYKWSVWNCLLSQSPSSVLTLLSTLEHSQHHRKTHLAGIVVISWSCLANGASSECHIIVHVICISRSVEGY